MDLLVQHLTSSIKNGMYRLSGVRFMPTLAADTCSLISKLLDLNDTALLKLTINTMAESIITVCNEAHRYIESDELGNFSNPKFVARKCISLIQADIIEGAIPTPSLRKLSITELDVLAGAFGIDSKRIAEMTLTHDLDLKKISPYFMQADTFSERDWYHYYLAGLTLNDLTSDHGLMNHYASVPERIVSNPVLNGLRLMIISGQDITSSLASDRKTCSIYNAIDPSYFALDEAVDQFLTNHYSSFSAFSEALFDLFSTQPDIMTFKRHAFIKKASECGSLSDLIALTEHSGVILPPTDASINSDTIGAVIHTMVNIVYANRHIVMQAEAIVSRQLNSEHLISTSELAATSELVIQLFCKINKLDGVSPQKMVNIPSCTMAAHDQCLPRISLLLAKTASTLRQQGSTQLACDLIEKSARRLPLPTLKEMICTGLLSADDIRTIITRNFMTNGYYPNNYSVHFDNLIDLITEAERQYPGQGNATDQLITSLTMYNEEFTQMLYSQQNRPKIDAVMSTAHNAGTQKEEVDMGFIIDSKI